MINNSIDILLPTYNGESFLGEQIESILSQTHQDFRLLIRDDRSSDKTNQIISYFQEKDSRIKVLIDDLGNLGLQKNIEHLLKFSTADLIFFSDQDDVWMEDKIEKFLKEYKHTDEPVLVHSNCFVTDSSLNIQSKFIDDNVALKLGVYNAFFNYFVQGASSMINSNLKKMLLPFPEYIYIHDRYIHLMAELYGKRIYIPDATMLYRQHGNNLIGSNSLISKIMNINLKSNFYLLPDKELFKILQTRQKYNIYINNYMKLTSNETSRFKKISLIRRLKIPLRFKEKILLLFNN